MTNFLYRPNVWLLTSVSDQATADRFIPPLLLTCRSLAPVLGVSAEPILGPINFRVRPSPDMCLVCGNGPNELHYGHEYQRHGLDWVIFGGESGPKARPCNLRWIKDGVRQCHSGGIAAFVKQLGGFVLAPHDDVELRTWAESRQHLRHEWPGLSTQLYEMRLDDSKGGDPAGAAQESGVEA